MSRRKQPRVILLFSLLLTFPLLGGCSLGWLYMKMADSQRIKAIKLLTYDNSKDRFTSASKLFKHAVENYREAILYDEDARPEEFHKLGFTLLMGDKPDAAAAEAEFKYGLKLKKSALDKAAVADAAPDSAPPADAPKKDEPKWADRGSVGSGSNKQDISEGGPKPVAQKNASSNEAYTDEEIKLENALELADRLTEKSKDEDFALMNAGMGQCHFLRGMREKKEDDLRIATKYFRLADKFSRHPSIHHHQAVSFMQKILAAVDLDEVVGPVPFCVDIARVYDYQGQQLLELGQEKLADNALGSALDSLDAGKLFYETEPRYQLEMANYHYLRKEYSKCLSFLQDVKGAVGFDEVKMSNTLKAKSLVATAKFDDAMNVVNDLVERDPQDANALLLRATVNASKSKDIKVENDVGTDVEAVFATEANQKDPVLYMQAGDIYMAMTQTDGAFAKAKRYYMKAFYIEPANIKANYVLGKCYQALNDTANMKDCFLRVCKIDPTSSYCHDVDPLIR